MADSRLMLDLGFFYYETPFLANAIFFVAFFLVGVLISYFFGLFRQFRDAKTIKMLKAKEASLVETVSSLEKRLSNSEATATAAIANAATPIVGEEQLETADEVK